MSGNKSSAVVLTLTLLVGVFIILLIPRALNLRWYP